MEAGTRQSALKMGLPFGAVMIVVLMLSSDGSLLSSTVVGAVSGVLFGVVMASFEKRQHEKFAFYDPSSPEEELIRRGGANHRKNIEAVGGYLYLTDKRLVFASHRYNLQSHEFSIPLAEISSVQPRRTMFVIPNGLEVVRGRDKERFVVHDRRGWMRELRQRVPAHGGLSR